MAKYMATIAYGPDVEWGGPEKMFEALLTQFGIHDFGVDAGTDMQTGERDYTCYFDCTPEEAKEIQASAPAWSVREYTEE